MPAVKQTAWRWTASEKSRTDWWARKEMPITDSILFQSLFKGAVLLEVYGKFEQATRAYLQALPYAPDETRKLKMYVFSRRRILQSEQF